MIPQKGRDCIGNSLTFVPGVRRHSVGMPAHRQGRALQPGVCSCEERSKACPRESGGSNLNAEGGRLMRFARNGRVNPPGSRKPLADNRWEQAPSEAWVRPPAAKRECLGRPTGPGPAPTSPCRGPPGPGADRRRPAGPGGHRPPDSKTHPSCRCLRRRDWG